MATDFYKLKGSVIAEPLVNHWYAWCNLIAPHTYSMYLHHRIMPALKSFIKAPEIHKSIAADPKFLGGIFVNLEKNFIDEAIALVNKLDSDYFDLSTLAIDIKKLFSIVETHSIEGLSFSEVYDTFPHSLNGCAELTYDTLNNPCIKFFEPILYKSKFYKEQAQSVLLYEGDPDNRTFVLSTPRFKDSRSFAINLPFKNTLYDKLFNSRSHPITYHDIEFLFSQLTNNTEYDKFFSLFEKSDENYNIVKNTKNENNGVEVKYFGHACVLVTFKNISILVDPFIAYSNQKSHVSRFTYADLPDVIDYVLITHSHQDHAVLESLLQIRYKIKNIIVPHNYIGSILDPSLKLFLNACGFNNVIQADEMDTIDIPFGKIICLPFFGEHGDLSINSKLSYIINISNKSIMFMADSNNISPMTYQLIYQHHVNQPIDAIFIGMECVGAPANWLYSPLIQKPLSKRQNLSRRLNGSDYQKALRLIHDLCCKYIYIYAMGDEPWLKFISSIKCDSRSLQSQESDKLIHAANELGLPAKKLYGCQKIDL